MANNNPSTPFNGIRLAYDCQACGGAHTGTPVRAPSGIVMGNTLLEKHVCAQCQQDHAENLNNGFWGSEKMPVRSGCCPGCNANLVGEKSYRVHSELKSDGTWKTAQICAPCFEEYKLVCTKNMETKS